MYYINIHCLFVCKAQKLPSVLISLPLNFIIRSPRSCNKTLVLFLLLMYLFYFIFIF